MSELRAGEYSIALRQFQEARRQADLQRLWARLTGRSAELLPFEEVRKQLGSTLSGRRELREVPLASIVGSVGRYKDFTRTFLPLRDSDSSRWARVKVAADGLVGLPPIEVYQLGEFYFVLDGNHRVSVAKQAGATFIEAYVTQVDTRVPLSPEDNLDDLLLKAELVEFLEYTNLDRLRPDYQLRVTAPGQYLKLMEYIDIHHYYLSREAGRKIPFEEAVIDWYDNIFLPVVQLIQERGILRDFPTRTETDLFVWISKHREEVSDLLGWTIDPERAALDFAQQATRPGHVAERLLETVTPELLDAGPDAPALQAEGLPQGQSLFREILVGCNGRERGLQAFEQALIVAAREGGRVHGLHIVDSPEDRYSETVGTLRDVCNRRLNQENIEGELVVQARPQPSTSPAALLVERSRWADLLVVGLEYPPSSDPLKRLSSGMAQILRRCPRPVLTVPVEAMPLAHGLLAFDGSPKSREALYIATYLAARWQIELTVVTVRENAQVGASAHEQALAYLDERGVSARPVLAEGPILPALLSTAEENDCDFFILGGYGHTPVLEVVLGSTVNELLRTTARPALICR